MGLRAFGATAVAVASGCFEFVRSDVHQPESTCLNGPCAPGNDFCGKPFKNAPAFHLMDQHGCGENDPNGPVFDPVHGVFHHFYQIHLAYGGGHGPDYGHFVSKDFVHWADVRTAIWNGLDTSVTPPRETKYDNEAIFTGSAFVLDGAGPGGKSPGIVNIYPGLCNKNDWPACGTGTILAQAVPADYAGDELLINWTKPSYNPIMENTQRDPSSPWKTPSGEWRLRTFNQKVYAASSDADVMAGKWYEVGTTPDFRGCECPSFYPLPAATPGLEAEYEALSKAGTLPTHVHKTSCGGDWWQLGTYFPGKPKELDHFNATPGWEAEFAQKRIDQGNFYASKDNVYPTRSGGKRRINWGWATVPPASTQTLPREITFNPLARTLEQAPVEELQSLRGPATSKGHVAIKANKPVDLALPSGFAKQSEVVVTFTLPSTATTFGITIGHGAIPSGTAVKTEMSQTDMPGDDYNITHYPANTNPTVCQSACETDPKCKAWTYVIRGSPAGSGDCCLKNNIPCPRKNMDTCTSGAKVDQTLPGCGGSATTIQCTIEFTPPTADMGGNTYYEVPVQCGSTRDTLRLLPREATVELRVFNDWTFLEAFFQKGRVAMTVVAASSDDTGISLMSTADVTAAAVTAYPLNGIWVAEDEVRKAPRVYSAIESEMESLIV